jgi:hypothetical protein
VVQSTTPEPQGTLASQPSAASAAESPQQAVPSPEAVGREEGSRSIDHRRERIRVDTVQHRIEGNVTLARDGFRSRVSDMLNASERDFLTLTDAIVAPLDGSPSESHRFLAVARRHIVFAVLADDPE